MYSQGQGHGQGQGQWSNSNSNGRWAPPSSSSHPHSQYRSGPSSSRYTNDPFSAGGRTGGAYAPTDSYAVGPGAASASASASSSGDRYARSGYGGGRESSGGYGSAYDRPPHNQNQNQGYSQAGYRGGRSYERERERDYGGRERERDYGGGRERERGERTSYAPPRGLDRPLERDRDRERDREREPLLDPESRLLRRLTRPFSDVPVVLPPREVLTRLTRLTRGVGDNALSTPSELLRSAGVPAGSMNPTAFRWAPYHSQALDELLRVAARRPGGGAEDGEDGEEDEGAGARGGEREGEATHLTSLKSKTAVANTLCRLCGIATLAARFGQVTLSSTSTSTSAKQSGDTSTTTSGSGWTKAQTNAALDILYDYCEESAPAVRFVGYESLFLISCANPSLVRRNADVLTQLLQIQEPAELRRVRAQLAGLIRLQPATTLRTMLGEHTRANAELRAATLAFLTAPPSPSPSASSPDGEAQAQAHATEDEQQHLDAERASAQAGLGVLALLQETITEDAELEAEFAGWVADLLFAVRPLGELLSPAVEGDAEALAKVEAKAQAQTGENAMETEEEEEEEEEAPSAASTSAAVGYAQTLPDLQRIATLLKECTRTLWIDAADFITEDAYLRAQVGVRKLFDALALKAVEKVRALLGADYAYLLFERGMREAHRDDARYQLEVRDATLELAQLHANGEELLAKLNAELVDEGRAEERLAEELNAALAAAAAASAAPSGGAGTQGQGMEVDTSAAGPAGPSGAMPPGAELQKVFNALLEWVSQDEPEFLVALGHESATAPRYEHQSTYERLRQKLFGYHPIAMSSAPTRSTLQLVSPCIRPLLLRTAALAALSRRKDAAAHGSAAAHDATMSMSLGAALRTVARVPDAIAPSRYADKQQQRTEIVEAAEAALWALSMSMPLVSPPFWRGWLG